MCRIMFKNVAMSLFNFTYYRSGYWFTRYDRHAFSGSLRGWHNILADLILAV
jgi:hypothetical protein